MFSYIFQIISFQLLFLVLYELLLKKETFFNWNRWYLLLTSIASLFLPLLEIEALALILPQETASGISTVWLPDVIIGDISNQTFTPGTAQTAPSGLSINWWLLAYTIGVIVSLVILIGKYKDLSRLFRFRTVTAEKNLQIIEIPNSTIACTFYNTIFLGDNLSEVDRQQILRHELVHVRQKHSLDLIYFETLKVIFWFNPLVYIFQNRIATLHEFLADADAVKTTEKSNYYEQLLNSAFNTSNISFINQFFNHSLIKKRIVMLQKTPSKTIAKAKYLLLLPLIIGMLAFVACSEEKTLQESEEAITLQEDEALKAALWEEIIEMDKNGVGFQEISKAFFIEENEHIKSKEAYYRMQAFMKLIHQKNVEREKAAGTYDKNSKNPFQTVLDQSYEEYVAMKKQQEPVKRNIPANNTNDSESVPFAVIDEVPVFPGCENLSSNEEQKNCMSQKVQEHVQKEFNTGLGKELGLTGLNRIIAVFKISENGNVIDIRARAPHPDLEAEAIRIISTLPTMVPGKQNGQEVNVSYSLPIVFQVAE